MPRPPRALALAPLVLLAACSGNPFAIARPTIENRVDTLQLFALVGTPISSPSALRMIGSNVARQERVRTDQTSDFEFAFDILPGGQPALIPLAALGATSAPTNNPGFIPRSEAFEAITEAPLNGWVSRDTQRVNVGDRLLVRSRIVCSIFQQPVYGKLQVLAVDPAARTVTFQIMTGANCGYRQLRPGLPSF
ncbi:MAG: hypothetical protein NW201_07605 [Gemmatimonadales bacterium]|nr:hypothetical protein [Gemmatimonadales bacterium]